MLVFGDSNACPTWFYSATSVGQPFQADLIDADSSKLGNSVRLESQPFEGHIQSCACI
jgi:hypothetical protein